MKRKLIKQGGGGYTVYLPKKWIDSRKLKAGDEISIEARGKKLVIDTEVHPEQRAISIVVKDTSVLRSIVGVAYRAGYNRITLNLEKKANISEIQDMLNFFTGLEIEDFTDNKVVLRCITSASAEQYDFFVKKIFLTNKLMIDEIVGFLDGNKFNFQNIDEMRKNNLKAREYCMRAINMQKISEKGACDEYTFIHILEKMSGTLWHMGQYISKNKLQKSDAVKKELLFIKDILDKSYHVYLKKDFRQGTQDVLPDRYKLRKEWFLQDKLAKLYKTKNTDPVLLALAVDARRRVTSAMARYLSIIVEVNQGESIEL
jgi:hypothetical protein